jgi:hypothetical protein
MSAYGYLREDDDGHWYLIPEDKVQRFRELMDKLVDLQWVMNEEWEETNDAVINEFDEYRLSGGPYDLKIQMENIDE